MYAFWINRNYKQIDGRREETGSICKAGEFHWRYDESCSIGGHVSWHWGTRFCHLIFTCDTGDDYDYVVSIGIPWVLSLWFVHSMPQWFLKWLPQHHYKIPQYERLSANGDEPNIRNGQLIGYKEGSYPEPRQISLAIHSGALWWKIWIDGNEWRSTDAWWRRGSLHFDDVLLGRRKYKCKPLTMPQEATVSMLEGDYPVVVRFQEERWWRSRWPWWPLNTRRQSYDIKCDVGIPFPGKGTADYNCEEDALFGTSINAVSQEEACQNFGQIVLDYRRRYGGELCASEPWSPNAESRIAEYTARQGQQDLGKHALKNTGARHA